MGYTNTKTRKQRPNRVFAEPLKWPSQAQSSWRALEKKKKIKKNYCDFDLHGKLEKCNFINIITLFINIFCFVNSQSHTHTFLTIIKHISFITKLLTNQKKKKIRNEKLQFNQKTMAVSKTKLPATCLVAFQILTLFAHRVIKEKQ